MEVATTRSLRSAENLSLPQVQVIVMSANMSCSHCRQRVSKVVSKMNSLLEYMVDLRKKEITMRGVVESKKRKSPYTCHLLYVFSWSKLGIKLEIHFN
ncbi:hypothetical protein OPV22_001419 [Ensete ventricosum]|uniref:HMA domain-containing protein n=1 Tax=Ensete ventricosum TaxID=4639 RepID=A0AAV8RVU3_ENSVE|nr:hypothetical protein OPV22_001419 [Ensete ventricosum]